MFKIESLNQWHANAKSMDGSGGAMYLSRGVRGITHYHIYMPGGYFCYNMEMCFERCRVAPMLCSTKGWESNVVFSGVFDPESGGMSGYTHSVIGYTSSDAFLGDVRLDNFEVVDGTVVLPSPRKRTTLAGHEGPYVCEDWVTKAVVHGCHAAIRGTWFQGLNMLKGALRKMMYLELGGGTRPPRHESVTDQNARLAATTYNAQISEPGEQGTTDEQTLVLSGCSAAAIGLAPLADAMWGILQDEMWNLNISNFKFPKVMIIMDSAPIAAGPAPINGQMGLVDQSQALLYMLVGMHDGKFNFLTTLTDCYSSTARPSVLSTGKKWTASGAELAFTPAYRILSARTRFLTTGSEVPLESNGNLCVYSGYMLPFIRTPNMVYHTYWDSFALQNQASAVGGMLNATTYAFGLKLVYEEMTVLDRGTKSQMMFGFNC